MVVKSKKCRRKGIVCEMRQRERERDKPAPGWQHFVQGCAHLPEQSLPETDEVGKEKSKISRIATTKAWHQLLAQKLLDLVYFNGFPPPS